MGEARACTQGRGERQRRGTTAEAEEDYEGNDRRRKKRHAGTGQKNDQETFTLGSQHTGPRSRNMVGGGDGVVLKLHYPPSALFDVEMERRAALDEHCWRTS
jgi:hypothetical protein